jgi:DNA polymerase-4
VGIGPNKLVAKVASDAEKPRGFVVISREQACEWFAGRPCGLIPGIGPKTVERLRVLRIESIAQLAGADEQQLWEAFGERQGSILKSRAAFIDGSPVVSNRKAVSESRETTFDTDLSDRTELLERLAGLSADLCSALHRHGHEGRTIGIKIRYANFETHTRARTLSALTSDQETVTRVARELFEEFDPQHPVRLIGVRVAGFQTPEAASGQMSLPLS